MADQKKKNKDIIYLLVYLAIVAVGWVVTPPAPITVPGMRIVCLFLAAVFAWSVTSSLWPTLLTLIIIPFTGLSTSAVMLATGFGCDTFVFSLLLFVFIAFFDETGTMNVLANWMMTRNFLKGHPYRLFTMIFVITWVLSMFCGCFAGMMLVWQFAYKICDMLGYKPFDKFSTTLVLGIAVAGMISMPCIPWQTPAVVMLNTYTAAFGVPINSVHYLAFTLPAGLLSVFAYVALCKFVFRVDVSRLKNFDVDALITEKITLNKHQKVAMGALVFLIVLLLLPSILPAGNTLKVILDSMGLTVKALLVIFILCLITIDGEPVLNFGKMASKATNWDMLYMLATIFCFVSLLSNPETGISAFLSGVFLPVFAGKPAAVFIVLVVVVTVLLTNVMNNMVVAAIMITATIPIAISLGIDSLQMAYLITTASCIALLLPPSSAPALVMYANTQWVRAKDVYIYVTPAIITTTIVFCVWNFIIFMF